MSLERLPHLDTFVHAAERGGFTVAARHLGITQAAVSQRIQQLEKTLGVSLFRRQAGGVLLTKSGRDLYEYARRILNLAEEARAAVTGVSLEVRGELLLAASSVPGEHLLPKRLVEFHKKHASIQIRVSVSDTETVLRGVEQGEVHLGIVGGMDGRAHFQFQSFASDELVVVASKGHPWYRRRTRSLDEFLSQPLIHREAGSGSRRCLERSLESLGVHAPLNVALELGSNEAVKEAVLQGLGIAVLSRHVVQEEIRSGGLRTVPVKGLNLKREISAVRDRRRAMPPAAQLFWASIEPRA
ncbi:MAG: LysR family transcriptional regulator [Gemmataceae bacterium]|nr:LysR family transcriptional regulator [Gemmataceae bacterium]